eukprot:gene8162-12019_t
MWLHKSVIESEPLIPAKGQKCLLYPEGEPFMKPHVHTIEWLPDDVEVIAKAPRGVSAFRLLQQCADAERPGPARPPHVRVEQVEVEHRRMRRESPERPMPRVWRTPAAPERRFAEPPCNPTLREPTWMGPSLPAPPPAHAPPLLLHGTWSPWGSPALSQAPTQIATQMSSPSPVSQFTQPGNRLHTAMA